MPRKKKVKPDRLDLSYVVFGAKYLRERLALFGSIMDKKAIRKDTASYHLTVTRDGVAILAATDLAHSLRLRLDVMSRLGWGQLMIDARALNAMIATYVEPRIKFDLSDPIKIAAGGLQTKLTLPGYDPEKEMKQTAEPSLTTSGWVFRGVDLARAIERTRFAMGDEGENTRYPLNGIAFDFPEESGSKGALVATNGRRLTLYRAAAITHGADPARVWRAPRPDGGIFLPVLPKRVVSLARKLAIEAGQGAAAVAVVPAVPKDLTNQQFGEGLIQVVTRDAVLTARIPDGCFPRYRDVWPTGEVLAELRLDHASRWGELLASAVSATDSEHTTAEITMAGGAMMMIVESGTKGKAVLSMLVPASTGKATFEVDALMLRQFFDAIGDDRLVMKFYGADQGLVFLAGADHELIQMPVMKDQPVPKSASAPPAAPEPEEEEEDEDDGSAPIVIVPDPVVPVAPAKRGRHRANGEAKKVK